MTTRRQQYKAAMYEAMTVPRLQSLAKTHNIAGRSTMRKAELVRALAVAPAAPMGVEQRTNAYQRANGKRPLTRRQMRQIGRMAKRNGY